MSGVKAIGIEIPDLNGDNIVGKIVNGVLETILIKGKRFDDPVQEINVYTGAFVNDYYQRLIDSLDRYDINNKDIIGIQTSIEISKEDCQKIVDIIKKKTNRDIYVFSHNFANGLFNYMDARKIVEGIGNEVVIIKNFN